MTRADDDTTPTILKAALRYAELGVPVCPTIPDASKKPRPGLGSLHASTDPAVITEWWRRWPTSNVALRTGVVYDVLDIDIKHGQPGWASLTKVRAARLLAGSGRIVRTPSGGAHVYFQPSGRGSSALTGTGLEYKGKNVLCTAPPSVIDGVAYRVEREQEPTRVLDWDAVRQLLQPRAVRIERTWDGVDVEHLVRWVEQLLPGERNRGTFWACCRAVEAGADLGPLIDAAVRTGLPVREAQAVGHSARRTAVAA